jgi:hypothetical protein
MPVCRLIPGMHKKDQCEEIPGFWGDLDQDSKDLCKQQTPCGPVRPAPTVYNPWALEGGKRRNQSRKTVRRNRRQSHRKASRKAHRKY